MKPPFRLLLLEGKPEDSEFVLYHLRREGYEPNCCGVESEAGFVADLDRSLDIILADSRHVSIDPDLRSGMWVPITKPDWEGLFAHECRSVCPRAHAS